MFSNLPEDILCQMNYADKIRQEFYQEKFKVDRLLREALSLCNSITNIEFKKSVVRSSIRSNKS